MEVSLATHAISSISVTGKHHSAAIKAANFLPLSLKSPSPQTPAFDNSTNSANSSHLSGKLRRPKTLKTATSPSPKIPSNPLKSLAQPSTDVNGSRSLTNKLWLTSKLSPPAPNPPEISRESDGEAGEKEVEENADSPRVEFRQEGKIFVGNLPSWIRKNDVAEFFRQFGPIKSVILIKAHEKTDRNAGFGFVLYGGSTAAKSAMKAVEFDGVEFHGRVLTVKLDDGRRLKGKTEERERWIGGDDGVEYRSKWHEERDGLRKEFRKVVETEPENWQAVVDAFQRIKKVKFLIFFSF